ncbi:MAG: hypothetical protein LBT05_15555 [Planctomycetaceae bacterium]|jgi:hypothetical protein|nr:hypothetical protein [Planctomycetaceae bacterium]
MFATLKTTLLEHRQKTRHRAGWMIVRSLVATVLFIAAGLKAYQPDLGNSIFETLWFQTLLIESEITLALILLFNVIPKISWLITTLLFTIFSVVSLAKGLSGAESCGCWGAAVQVNPYFTVVLDLFIIGLLTIFRPSGIVFRRQAFFQELTGLKFDKRFFAVVGIWLVVALPVAYAMTSVQKNDLAEFGTEFIGADGKKIILLEPEKWIDKEFPLLPYIESKEKFDKGLWLVLLYKHTCSSCRECQRLYHDLSKDFSQRNDCPNIAMIEAPPFETDKNYQLDSKTFFYGKLTKTQKWRMDSPILILVENHYVKSHFTNPLDIDLIRAIWRNGK